MLTDVAFFSCRFHAAGASRRGGVSIFVLISMIVFLACFVLAVDIAHLWEAQTSMQISTDAAALAADESFVNDQMLLGEPSVVVPLIVQARASAILYAQNNTVFGDPLDLDPNYSNDPTGDIVFGFQDTPQTTFVPTTGDLTDTSNAALTQINAIQINGRRTRALGNPVALLLGQVLGMPSADVISTTTVMLDRDVVGLRPVNNIAIPLAPIAILSDPTGVNVNSWEYLINLKNGPDAYAFNSTTKTFSAGSDGLPEITITLDTSTGCLLFIGTSDVTAASNQLLNGVSTTDVAGFGGQLLLDSTTNTMIIPNAANGGPTQGTSDYDILQQNLIQVMAQGSLRIWPLFTSVGGGVATIDGFVAARIANIAAPVAGGPITITLQPGVLSTGTALTNAAQRGVNGIAITNPYVSKVRVVQ